MIDVDSIVVELNALSLYESIRMIRRIQKHTPSIMTDPKLTPALDLVMKEWVANGSPDIPDLKPPTVGRIVIEGKNGMDIGCFFAGETDEGYMFKIDDVEVETEDFKKYIDYHKKFSSQGLPNDLQQIMDTLEDLKVLTNRECDED